MKGLKERRVFHIHGFDGTVLGYGTYYPAGGNCQVYFKGEGYAAKQLNMLGDVMLFNGVQSIAGGQDYIRGERP